MKTDAEILDWMEENSHRLLLVRGRMGVKRFRFGSRDGEGHYTWHEPPRPTLREAVSAAIAFDQNGN